MLRAAHMHDLWVLKDQVIFKKITKRLNTEQDIIDSAAKARAMEHWHNIVIEIRKKKAEEDQRERFIDILRNSTRGQRSTMEKEEIRRFVANYMNCIPKSISFSEMDALCNELDWIPYIGRSILFLQGDFGNCYYMIASGRVGLYLEPSKDREMVIAREFGQQRLQPFQGTDEDLLRLGQNIINLPVSRIEHNNHLVFMIFIVCTVYFVFFKARSRIWRVRHPRNFQQDSIVCCSCPG